MFGKIDDETLPIIHPSQDQVQAPGIVSSLAQRPSLWSLYMFFSQTWLFVSRFSDYGTDPIPSLNAREYLLVATHSFLESNAGNLLWMQILAVTI